MSKKFKEIVFQFLLKLNFISSVMIVKRLYYI